MFTYLGEKCHDYGIEVCLYVYHLELQPLKILELYSEYESCNDIRENSSMLSNIPASVRKCYSLLSNIACTILTIYYSGIGQRVG